MSNIARNEKRIVADDLAARPTVLVDKIGAGTPEDRSWFWDYLHDIFDSPDMDLSQFEHIENKRSPQSMRRNGEY